MMTKVRDGYTFANEGRVVGEEEIDYIASSGDTLTIYFKLQLKGNLGNSKYILRDDSRITPVNTW